MNGFLALPEKSVRGLIEAVWLAGAPEGIGYLHHLKDTYEKDKQLDKKIATFVIQILLRTPFAIDTVKVDSPHYLELFQIAFNISGNAYWISQLVDGFYHTQNRKGIESEEKWLYQHLITHTITIILRRHSHLAEPICEHIVENPDKVNEQVLKIWMIAKTFLSPDQSKKFGLLPFASK